MPPRVAAGTQWSLIVLRTLITLVALAALSLQALAGPTNLFSRKPKLDEAKARALVETLKSDPDEKKRKTAADELGRADSRANPDVAPALVGALRKDASAAVRAEAAASLRELGEVYPQAAVALDEAAETDSSTMVRLAAQRTLWEYHLSGYRSARGGDGLPTQTIEPPIASPVGPRQAVALVPAPAAPIVPPVPARVPPIVISPIPQLPAMMPQPVNTRPDQPAAPAAQQAGPRLIWPNVLPGARAAVRSMFTPAAPAPSPAPAASKAVSPPVSNLTNEPPVAKKNPLVTVAPPAPTPEPPLKVEPSVPDYVPTLPPFRPDLPSVVTPPWATPLPVPKLSPAPK